MHPERLTDQSSGPVSTTHWPAFHSDEPTADAQAAGPAKLPSAAGVLPVLSTTLPPAAFEELLAAQGSDVFVLSRDPGLVEVVKAAGGARHAIHVARELSRVREAVRGGDADVLLIDADLAGPYPSLERRIREFQALSKQLVIAVAASRETARDLIGLVSAARIHRLLIKPASLGNTRLLLESAANRHFRLRELAILEPAERPKRKLLAGFNARWPRWPAAAALAGVVVVAAIIGAWVAVRLADAPDAVSPGPAGDGSAATAGNEVDLVDSALRVGAISVEDLNSPLVEDGPPANGGAGALVVDRFAARLQAAAAAVAEGRIGEPVGDSAIDRYAAILAEDPGHSEAARELDALLEKLFADAEWALLEGASDEAGVLLAHIRRVRPSSGRLIFLETQMRQASAAAQADPAEEELETLLTNARLRLEQGQLSVPRGDSALDHFGRAAALAPDDPEVQNVSAELASAFAAAARVELERANVGRAEELIDQASRLDLDPETRALLNLNLSTAQQRLAERRQRDLLANGIERLEAGRFVEPENDSALFYLSTLRAENPEFSGLDVVWSRLLASVEANASSAIEATDWALAESWVESLAAAGAESARVESLRDEIEFRRRQADYLANPAATGELQLLERGSLVYPEAALARDVEGWVELDYVVGTDGIATNVNVVAAEPAGWFEEAAIESLAQSRYVPFDLDGKLYQRRARVRITFELQQ